MSPSSQSIFLLQWDHNHCHTTLIVSPLSSFLSTFLWLWLWFWFWLWLWLWSWSFRYLAGYVATVCDSLSIYLSLATVDVMICRCHEGSFLTSVWFVLRHFCCLLYMHVRSMIALFVERSWWCSCTVCVIVDVLGLCVVVMWRILRQLCDVASRSF